MAHQMTITLSDAEYAALAQEAAKSGKPVEYLLHELLTQHIKPSLRHLTTSRKVQEYLYQEGVIEQVPTNEPETADEEKERSRLAHLFGQGKSASQMVIEDRGPR
ncbi:MAG: hypothetical protein ABI406_17065 [Ktedonobacteraceae bacterium]